MKKMILSTVSLILAIALCACGNANDPNKDLSDQPSFNLPSETEPVTTVSETEPVPEVPTEEEQEMIKEYCKTYCLLKQHFGGNCSDLYQTLLTFDAEVLSRWENTEYAFGLNYSEAINWDLKEVLSNFTVIENVLLEQTYSTTDRVGNCSGDISEVTWSYDKNGNICSVTNEYMAYNLIDQFPENLGSAFTVHRDENGKIIEVVYGSGNWISDRIIYNYDESGRVRSLTQLNNSVNEEIVTYSYDASGNIIRQEGKKSVYTYTYNEKNQLVSSESTSYLNGKIWSQISMNYNYDENGMPLSATQRFDQYRSTFLSEENQLASYCIEEHKYTCDEYGNIIKVDIQCGPTYDLIDEEVEEPVKPYRTYNLIHGDYCIYNAD